MNVLITGGAGFIGSHIVDKLLQDNCKVIVVDNLSSGSLKNLPENFDLNSNLKFYQKDILNDDLSDVFETAFDRKERSHDFLWGGFIGIFP